MADQNPLLAGAPDWADAYSYNANALSNWVTPQRAPVWQMSNPVGTETTRQPQQLTMPTPGVQPVAFWGGQPVSQQFYDLGHQAQANALGWVGSAGPGGRAMRDNPAEFTKWFGKSKVVNDAGEPLTVYHGTKVDITQFDASLGKSKTDAPPWATFFTDDPALASSYARRGGAGANVVPAHLSLQNPIEATGRNWFALESPLEGTVWSPRYGQYVTIRKGDEVDINMLSGMAKDQGYDGLIARNVQDTARPSDKQTAQTTYVAFHPTQVKSAISNQGAYSPTDPRIAYGVGGLAAGGAGASGYRRDE